MQHRCCICEVAFQYPEYVKWIPARSGYAHQSCIRKRAGFWEKIKWVFKGCPKW